MMKIKSLTCFYRTMGRKTLNKKNNISEDFIKNVILTIQKYFYYPEIKLKQKTILHINQ